MIEFAVERTVDPMPEMLEKLFEKCEILISNRVLDVLKKMHSYTAHDNQYKFHRRTRGADVLYSFIVTTGAEGNKVSDLECYAELGRVVPECDMHNVQSVDKVYFMLQGE